MGNKLPGLVPRGNMYYVRKRVPNEIRHIIDRDEISKSLRTGDPKLARELYWKISAEIEERFSRARRSLKPHEPQLLTNEMARLFAVAWFSPKLEEEVESAYQNIGIEDVQEWLEQLDEDEANLDIKVDEVRLPGLQATADKILLASGFPILENPESKSQRQNKPERPNVDRRSDGYWALVNFVHRGEIERLRRVRDVLAGRLSCGNSNRCSC